MGNFARFDYGFTDTLPDLKGERTKDLTVSKKNNK
jgi:hypothetical protein